MCAKGWVEWVTLRGLSIEFEHQEHRVNVLTDPSGVTRLVLEDPSRFPPSPFRDSDGSVLYHDGQYVHRDEDEGPAVISSFGDEFYVVRGQQTRIRFPDGTVLYPPPEAAPKLPLEEVISWVEDCPESALEWIYAGVRKGQEDGLKTLLVEVRETETPYVHELSLQIPRRKGKGKELGRYRLPELIDPVEPIRHYFRTRGHKVCITHRDRGQTSTVVWINC